MPFRRRTHPTPPGTPAATPNGSRGGDGGPSFSGLDWTALVRSVERKRRLHGRDGDGHDGGNGVPADYYARATWASFRLEGHDVTLGETREALAPAATPDRPALRSRQAQRLRTHAAILHHLENDIRQGVPLTTDDVLRWYVGISAGLSTTGLDAAGAARVEDVVRRINSPQMRLQGALYEIASTHVRLLADPLVPSFNGILARLLLRYHLGRCKLPAVVFDPDVDARPAGAEGVVRRLVQLLNLRYDELLSKRPEDKA